MCPPPPQSTELQMTHNLNLLRLNPTSFNPGSWTNQPAENADRAPLLWGWVVETTEGPTPQGLQEHSLCTKERR